MRTTVNWKIGGWVKINQNPEIGILDASKSNWIYQSLLEVIMLTQINVRYLEIWSLQNVVSLSLLRSLILTYISRTSFYSKKFVLFGYLSPSVFHYFFNFDNFVSCANYQWFCVWLFDPNWLDNICIALSRIIRGLTSVDYIQNIFRNSLGSYWLFYGNLLGNLF